MFILNFKNSGKSILSQKAHNGYFFQNKKYIKNKISLPKSIKIGYRRNKKHSSENREIFYPLLLKAF